VTRLIALGGGGGGKFSDDYYEFESTRKKTHLDRKTLDGHLPPPTPPPLPHKLLLCGEVSQECAIPCFHVLGKHRKDVAYVECCLEGALYRIADFSFTAPTNALCKIHIKHSRCHSSTFR
jgi:hypothetical protein